MKCYLLEVRRLTNTFCRKSVPPHVFITNYIVLLLRSEEFSLLNHSLKTVAQKAACMTSRPLLCITVQGEYMA